MRGGLIAPPSCTKALTIMVSCYAHIEGKEVMRMGKRGYYSWQHIAPLLHRKPLAVLLTERLAECGSMKAVADSLGISRAALYAGMRQEGLTTKMLQGE